MSFKWTPTQARTSNIVDSSQFNESYRAYKGALNGSLDRSNLPHASIDRTRLANNFAHKVNVSNFNDTAGGYNVAGVGFRGFNYEQYQSGWQFLHSQSLTCKEGMLHIEMSAFVSVYKIDLSLPATPAIFKDTVAQFMITYNGMNICLSPEYGQPIMPVYMVAAIPCSEGNNDVRIYRRLTPAADYDDKNKPWVFTAGGSLLLINRYR